MVLVRLLLVLGLAAIGVAFLLFLFTRDRRYLRFIWQVVKLLVLALAGVLIFFAIERALIMQRPDRLSQRATAALRGPSGNVPAKPSNAAFWVLSH
jgi:energy-coupling factor transporter transmembrane protein EcfT